MRQHRYVRLKPRGVLTPSGSGEVGSVAPTEPTERVGRPESVPTVAGGSSPPGDSLLSGTYDALMALFLPWLLAFLVIALVAKFTPVPFLSAAPVVLGFAVAFTGWIVWSKHRGSLRDQATATRVAERRAEWIAVAVKRAARPFRVRRRAAPVAAPTDRRPKRNRRAVALLIPVALSCLSSGSAGKFTGGHPPPPRRPQPDDLTYPFGLDRPCPDLSDSDLRLRVHLALRFLAGGEP